MLTITKPLLLRLYDKLIFDKRVNSQEDFGKSLSNETLQISKSYINQLLKQDGGKPITEEISASVNKVYKKEVAEAQAMLEASGIDNKSVVEEESELYVKEGKKKEVITFGKHAPLRLKPEEYGEAFGDWPGLPMYNEPITAGFVATYRDELAHRPQYYLHDPRFRDCNFGAIITGDSMHSEIRHGDYAACKEIEDFSYITFGDIYYIVAKNGLETCKYVQRMKVGLREGAVKNGAQGGRYDELDIIYDDSKVLLVPYNRIVDPSPLPIDMILRLYKVRGIVRGY